MAKLPIATQCGTDAPAAPPRLDSSFRWNDEMGGGNLFHSNRSCRLAPAHQGMKRRRCGLVQRISTADSATPRPLRGTSPSPREVFDRATFSHSAIGHRSTIRHVSSVERRTLPGDFLPSI